MIANYEGEGRRMTETVTVGIETFSELLDNDTRVNILKRFCREAVLENDEYNKTHEYKTTADIKIELICRIMGWIDVLEFTG